MFSWISALGKCGSIRFSRRVDIDSASLGYCEVEELASTRQNPSADDVILLAKRYMGDPCPHKVIVMVRAHDAIRFQMGLTQPQGVSARRAIPPDVIKNIKAYGPRCEAQGILSRDANICLQAWCQDTVLLKPRPRTYSFLDHRQSSLRRPAVAGMPWSVPARSRHVNLDPGQQDASDGEADDADDDLFALPNRAG